MQVQCRCSCKFYPSVPYSAPTIPYPNKNIPDCTAKVITLFPSSCPPSASAVPVRPTSDPTNIIHQNHTATYHTPAQLPYHTTSILCHITAKFVTFFPSKCQCSASLPNFCSYKLYLSNHTATYHTPPHRPFHTTRKLHLVKEKLIILFPSSCSAFVLNFCCILLEVQELCTVNLYSLSWLRW